MAEPYHIRISSRALADMRGIFEYIRQDSPQNAADVIRRILDAIDGLDYMPSRFKRAGRSRKLKSPIHAMVIQPFIVYYRIDVPTRGVFILEIRHGAQRQPRRFE